MKKGTALKKQFSIAVAAIAALVLAAVPALAADYTGCTGVDTSTMTCDGGATFDSHEWYASPDGHLCYRDDMDHCPYTYELADSSTSETTTTTTTSSSSSSSSSSTDTCAASKQGLAAATQDVSRSNSQTVARLAGGRVAGALAPRPSGAKMVTSSLPGDIQIAEGETFSASTGMAGGDVARPIGLWATGSVSWLGNTKDEFRNSGNAYVAMAGADYKPIEDLVVGLGLGYESANLDTSFNDGDFNNDGFVMTPYAGYAILDNLTIDVTGGFSWLHNKVNRNFSPGLDVGGSYDSFRAMISTNLNYYYLYENWNFGAVLGYMYVNEHQDSYTQSNAGVTADIDSQDVWLSEMRLGGRVGYFFEQVEPYLGLAYILDTAMSDHTGRAMAEMEGLIGVNWFATDAFSMGLECANSFFRGDEYNTRLMLNLRYEF